VRVTAAPTAQPSTGEWVGMQELTLHAALDKVAADHGEATVTFPSEHTELRLDELVDESALTAARLRGLGIGAGDRVGVLCSNEADFLLALFALSRLGACACPMPLPTTGRDGYSAKIASVVECGRIGTVLVSRGLRRIRSVVDGALTGVRRLPMDQVHSADAPAPVDGADVGPDADIILQFTSGSTAYPKGVRLTHRNVQACLAAIRTGIELSETDSLGSWLPLFHDMGLFGTLTAILSGVPAAIWQPSAFVKDPASWLGQFAGGRFTCSPLPTFGYDYLVRAIPAEQVAGYDLSAWRVAFNGAEPVGVGSVESFLNHFAPAGFAPEAMLPVYGLAEATLAVTFPPVRRGPRVDWVDRAGLTQTRRARPVARGAPGVRGLVSVGGPVLGMSVRIADPDAGGVLAERCVGEVQLRGASVTAGYVDHDGTVAQPFTADGWLRTGDLGYLAGGELYITGRIKEMLILRGANFFPDDVESAVRDDPGVHMQRCVAFVDEANGRERMVLVAETTAVGDEQDMLVERLRRLVGSAIGLDDLLVRLTPPNSIPRTSSGKLQRIAAKSRFS
jgi:fatty-acyl-CoA synthase